jgi:hypothetical protein
MAVNGQKKLPWGSVRGPHVLVLYLAGMIAVYVGERLVGGQDLTRLLVSGGGAAAVLASCVAWLLAWLRGEGPNRQVERLSALLSLGGLAALGVYLMGSDLLLGPAPLTKAPGGVTLRQVLAVAWPVLAAGTVLPMIFTQISVASMARGKGIEIGRVQASARSGAVTAIFLSTLFLVNAIADRKDIHRDLSYFKTTSPSEATRSMIEGLDTDTSALLFFPSANDVLEEVRPYFEELDGLSARFKVEVVDKAMDPELARKHRVSGDGTVLLIRGEAKQKITVGAKLDRAKRSLRKLDQEFQKAMLKLNRNRETVYLISGHGERGPDKTDLDNRSPILVLKKFLMALNLAVKHLGPVEGLASEVPPDAALLIWTDPVAPLFPGEFDAIKAYLERGGRMLVTLDTDSGDAAGELLAFLGLKYSPVKLAHERAFIPIDRTPADVYNIVTASFSSHPSVTTVSRESKRFPVLMPTSGSLEKGTSGGNKIVFTVRSMPETWADADGDMKRGKDEKARVYQLAAAVSRKIKKPPEELAKKPEPPAPSAKKDEEKKPEDPKAKDKAKDKAKAKAKDKAKDKAKKDKKKETLKPEEMRVVVFADSDVFSDRFVGFRLSYNEIGGNMQLLADVLRWLADEDRVPGLPRSEEDVKIVHSRNEDVYWFYGTVFPVPLLILGAGVGTRWGRGRRRGTAR